MNDKGKKENIMMGAVKDYAEGKLSLGKAAETAGVSMWLSMVKKEARILGTDDSPSMPTESFIYNKVCNVINVPRVRRFNSYTDAKNRVA